MSGKPRFRAEHVGSLLRPGNVLQARTDFEAGRISAVQLRGIEDGAIRAAVRLQEEAGLPCVTDGELRHVDKAARYVNPDQLALSPQCGFASTLRGNLLTEAEQFAKLRLVFDTAREIWGSA